MDSPTKETIKKQALRGAYKKSRKGVRMFGLIPESAKEIGARATSLKDVGK